MFCDKWRCKASFYHDNLCLLAITKPAIRGIVFSNMALQVINKHFRSSVHLMFLDYT
jgi:hypothetical protein